jgi:predicted lipid-binding transport protein (Tim44 family)
MAALAVVVALTTVVDSVDARRLGGGRSFGAQRQSIAPPAAAPQASGPAAQPVMPAQPSASAPRAAAPMAPAAAPARSGLSRWMGPIAGIAAGLGLAALLSHFGLPEGFGSLLLLGLLAVGVIFVVRALFLRRAASPMQYAGAGAGTRRAEPMLSGNTRGDSAWGGPDRVEPVLGATTDRRIPPGFDRDGFLREARRQFNALQAAWDAADRRTLSTVTTPQMFEEIQRDLAGRSAHEPTAVVRLDAELLEVVTEGAQHWASVRFTGLLREDGSDVAKPFDETWNLTKPVDGSSGWLLAGIQQNEAALAQ